MKTFFVLFLAPLGMALPWTLVCSTLKMVYAIHLIYVLKPRESTTGEILRRQEVDSPKNDILGKLLEAVTGEGNQDQSAASDGLSSLLGSLGISN